MDKATKGQKDSKGQMGSRRTPPLLLAPAPRPSPRLQRIGRLPDGWGCHFALGLPGMATQLPESSPATRIRRRLPIGAEQAGTGVHFRVWAPASETAAIELLSDDNSIEQTHSLEAEPGGYYSGSLDAVAPGRRYRIRLDSGSYPDPASRFQPDGPHGPSAFVDPGRFRWNDEDWRGRPLGELVVYELHVGTFTPEGTWRAAAERLPGLAEIGITMIEMMPVAEFPGRCGWGYDGVNPFAPTHLYGTPDDLRAFVDRAHSLGIAVILDVVYNHFGPDGNYLHAFSPHYVSRKYANEWGDALNFDGDSSGPVREYFVANARHWIEEYRLDGLRFDATQQIYDESKENILAEIARAARAAAHGRRIFLVAENECQRGILVRPPQSGGYGLDAIWNDDFHHAAHVSAAGRAEAYFSGYRGVAQEFVSCAKHGFLYQGQWFQWQKQRRGRPALDLDPTRFVVFLQNHDQVANSLRGHRIHQLTSPARYRALTALSLLGPQIPMLFQGQEFAASAPFVYFADHEPDLAKLVSAGRKGFLQQFSSIAACRDTRAIPDPEAPESFEACRLDWRERETNSACLQMHSDLLRLRREDPTLALRGPIDGAVLSEHAFVIRYFGTSGDDRLLVVNLGADTVYGPCPEPLLAPVEGHGWRILWSSEALEYGGNGTPPIETTSGWLLPAESGVVFCPDESNDVPAAKVSEKE